MSNTTLNRVKAGDLELKEKVVAINRVVKTTKGGRAFSFSALVVVGNENGVVGHGLGKAKEVQEAITKGIEDAKKNLIKVPVMHGTIPHDQSAKEGAAKVLIKPAAHGTGVIAGGSMRAVLESAGVTDVLAKSLGSANPHNVGLLNPGIWPVRPSPRHFPILRACYLRRLLPYREPQA